VTTKAEQLAARLGLVFQNQRLLEQALMHRSYINEHPSSTLDSNERLEFLGDAVLNFSTATLLYGSLPHKSEGELTSLRAALVKTPTLAAFARQLGLGPYVSMSKGEAAGGGRERDALLADVFEALLAAVYLDQGIVAAQAFLEPLLQGQIAQLLSSGSVLDHKSRLQELIQAVRGVTPHYRTVEVRGPDHQRDFTVEVWAGNMLLGVGRGSSKQVAAQAAALVALEALDASGEVRHEQSI
jgi:ribonuclease III